MPTKSAKRRLLDWERKQKLDGQQAILDRKVEEWHRCDVDVPLHQYLGMTSDEYADYTATGTIPDHLLH